MFLIFYPKNYVFRTRPTNKSSSTYLEEYDHALKERLKVEHVIDAFGLLDVHEERHSEYGVDEHDEHQQQADVEQRRE